MDNNTIKVTKVMWFDEKIGNEENQKYFKKLKSIFISWEGFQSLDQGFENFYKNDKGNKNQFKIIFVIVSGRLFGRYIKRIKDNINKIINIPYTFIFTSSKFKQLLLRQLPDKEHKLSYETMIMIKHGFYNPGGVYDNFNNVLHELKVVKEKIVSNSNIAPRIKDKINYEGILTFEYLESEEDLLAPALYKDIITNEKVIEEDCKKFHKYILSFNKGELNSLINTLDLFQYIPFEILSKYWAKLYTIESDFYKVLNNHLMKSKLPFNYKTFIKMFYIGVEINSLKSYQGKYLYRGSSINKIEIDKIKKYKSIGKLSNVVVFSKAFLSFSEDMKEAIKFIGKSNATKVGILFILENKNMNLHESNANIQNYSSFPDEKEIIFFPGSSFIIKNIKDINDNKIEILLNYNGKFKEKYSLIYDNQKKVNNLIYNNELTKNIAGKELCFLKGGQYLKGEKIGSIIGYLKGGGVGDIGGIFKGKDLRTDELVAIRQINKINYCINEQEKRLINEIKLLITISDKLKYTCKYKDYFQTENDFYLILSYYDDNLESFFQKHNKKLSPNLIKKIFKQLNLIFEEFCDNNMVHRDLRPENILIKYWNEDKTIFDCTLSHYKLCEDYSKENLYSMGTIVGHPDFIAPEIMEKRIYKNKGLLFSIGIMMYYLYFGKYPFNMENMLSRLKPFNINFTIEEDRELEDLIKKLIKENPDERITWVEYYQHPFFKQYEY